MLAPIAKKFHSREEDLRDRLTAIRKESRQRRQGRKRSPADTAPLQSEVPTVSAWERSLLELAILDPEVVRGVEQQLCLNSLSAAARAILECCWQVHDSGVTPGFASLSICFDDFGTKNLIEQLDECCRAKSKADRQQWLSDLMTTVARRQETVDRRRVLDAARRRDEDAEALLANYVHQFRAKHLSDYERRKK
jgi:hypothetical protein